MPVVVRPSGAHSEQLFVAYTRVSSRNQAIHRVSLARQRHLIEEHASQNGATIIGWYSETANEDRSYCSERDRALTRARKDDAILLVSSIDRFTRDPRYFESVVARGVRVESVEEPCASREQLVKKISRERAIKKSRDAAAVEGRAKAKRKGTRFGDPTRGAARKKNSSDFARSVIEKIERIRTCGFASLNSIAHELNRLGISAPRGGVWRAESVKRVIKRAGHNDELET